MRDLLAEHASLERLATGFRWCEGPVWIPATGRVRWSDVVGNSIHEFDPASGASSVYRADSEYANGRTLDLDGSVIQCSHGRRRVERDRDGVLTAVADRWAEGRFNSPNDVVVSSDGAVWFTDPPYGIDPSGAEGHPGTSDYNGCYVFRVDPITGDTRPMITDMVHPNGLAFSPDESLLYVADTGYLQVDGAVGALRVYDMVTGRPVNGREFARVRPGSTDGLRIDADGRIWSSSKDAVQVLSTFGEVLLTIPVPETVSNLAFGGDGFDLYITATTSLYRIRTTVREARHPTRSAGR
jgi:gluconolactonase